MEQLFADGKANATTMLEQRLLGVQNEELKHLKDHTSLA